MQNQIPFGLSDSVIGPVCNCTLAIISESVFVTSFRFSASGVCSVFQFLVPQAFVADFLDLLEEKQFRFLNPPSTIVFLPVPPPGFPAPSSILVFRAAMESILFCVAFAEVTDDRENNFPNTDCFASTFFCSSKVDFARPISLSDSDRSFFRLLHFGGRIDPVAISLFHRTAIYREIFSCINLIASSVGMNIRIYSRSIHRRR